MRRQNPLELVFEDISTFDAENQTVGSLLREIDWNKKQTDSDFFKSPPSHPAKEFEIQKRLETLRDIKIFGNNNNNNNDIGGDGDDGDDLINFVPTTPQNTNESFTPSDPNINEILNPLPE